MLSSKTADTTQGNRYVYYMCTFAVATHRVIHEIKGTVIETKKSSVSCEN